MPIALASVVPLALVVPAKAPYSTIGELAKALTGKKPLTFASAGTGTPGHFAGEFLKLRAKANLTHVPYKGAGPALNDLIGGHVDMYFPGFPAATPLLKAGTVKLLAVSSAKRSGAAPEIPTVAEAINDPNFDLTLWQGFFAPAATPKPVVERLTDRDQQDPRLAGDAGEAPRRRSRCAHRFERAVRSLHEIGSRQVRPDHQRVGREAGIVCSHDRGRA